MKRILLILSVILLTVIQTQGQVSRNMPDPSERILKLYPNPATTNITIDFQKDFEKGYYLEVFNFLGKKMFESQELLEKTTLNLSEYNRGIYIYHLRDRSGRVLESGKFQVSK